MAKQKQINLQVLLLMAGVYFTALSAAKASYVPYLSLYLRGLGLPAWHIGIIIACQNLLLASTAPCLSRFLIKLKYPRIFLLLFIILYLAGVLSFTAIPSSSGAGMSGVNCVGFGNGTQSPISKEVPLRRNGSAQEVVKSTPPAKEQDHPEPTVLIEATSAKSDIKVHSTIVAPVIEVTEGSYSAATPPHAPDRALNEAKMNIHDDKNKNEWDEPLEEGNIYSKQSDRLADKGNDQPFIQEPFPTEGNNPRSRSRVGSRMFMYPSRQDQEFVSNKRYRGQQTHSSSQGSGKYQGSARTMPEWRWQNERDGDYGGTHGRYHDWDWDQDQELMRGVSKDDGEGLKEDVLDWLLRRGQEQPQRGSYLQRRIKRNVPLGEPPVESTVANGLGLTETPKAGNNSTSDNTSTGVGPSGVFWIALLVVCLTGAFSGPVEHLCDIALYHQLDSIDELDKYKRPSLLSMPTYAVMGLVVGLLVDSIPCLVGGHSSHMVVHFYLSAALIGVIFLVGLAVPLSHKVKNSQEGKYFKSIKFLVSDSHTAIMSVTLVLTAMIASCADVFLFWLIQDLHGLETTMGVSLLIAYMTELPMSMVFTPWLVQKLGNVWLLALGTASLGLQNLYYSVLWSPWAVAPIQVLHALSRAAVRGCVLAFLNEASPPGMGKAVQVTVLAFEQGLGYVLGSIVWGLIYGVITVKRIFIVAAVVSLLWAVVLMICACRLPAKKRFMYAKLLQSEMEMEMKDAVIGSDSEDGEEKEWLRDAIRDDDEEE